MFFFYLEIEDNKATDKSHLWQKLYFQTQMSRASCADISTLYS